MRLAGGSRPATAGGDQMHPEADKDRGTFTKDRGQIVPRASGKHEGTRKMHTISINLNLQPCKVPRWIPIGRAHHFGYSPEIIPTYHAALSSPSNIG